MKQKCVIWGTRASGRQLARQAADMGYEPVAYCSSSVTSQGERIDGLPVISPEELRRMYSEKEVGSVLLGVKNPVYLREIKAAISQMPPLDVEAISAETDRLENACLQTAREQMRYRWDIRFEEQAELWLRNFIGEAESWVRDDADPKGVWHYAYVNRLENKEFLGIDSSCQELARSLVAGSVVMDIGSGLASMYGDRLPNGERIKLLAVDPLAPFYNRINQTYANGRNRICEFGLFEFIADFYEENYSDAILINNALDHCIDPFKSIVECLYILKCGGTMRLNHRRAEALCKAYQGLHKWNIDYNEGGELVFWNQENALNVSQRLKDIADIRLSHTDEQGDRNSQMVVAELTKKRSFRLEEFLDMAQERRQLAFLLKGLMDQVAIWHEKAVWER